MKTFQGYLNEVNSKYIVSMNPSDKKWYAMGHVGNNKWMPVSSGFKNKAQAQKWAKSQDKVDIAARGEISDAYKEKMKTFKEHLIEKYKDYDGKGWVLGTKDEPKPKDKDIVWISKVHH